MAVDPLAEKAFSWTPYRYGFDNPIRFLDIVGMHEGEREDAIKYMRDRKGENKNDCSGYVKAAISYANVDIDLGKFADGATNGVSQIVGNSRKSSVEKLKAGNAVTFKTDRGDHKGKDGEYDHIGVVSSVVRNEETGAVEGFNVIHDTTNGVKEQYYDTSKTEGIPGFELSGVYEWDSPDYKAEEQQEIVVSENITQDQKTMNEPVTPRVTDDLSSTQLAK